jgi:hypothetical protein
MAQNDTTECDEIRARLAAHALGAEDLTDADHAHLAGCAECRVAYEGFQRVAAALPATAPDVAPPVALRGRILAALDAELQQDAPQVRRAPVAPAPQPVQRPRRSGVWAAFALAAVALVALLGWNVSLQQQIEAQRAQLANSRSNWHLMTALLNDADVRWYAVAGAEATGHLWANPQGEIACLVAQRLPALTAGQVYQVWLEEGGALVSGGTFEPRDGDGWVLIRADGPFADYAAVLVTIEARGGSRAPTGPPILQGALTQAGAPDALQRAEALRLISETLR